MNVNLGLTPADEQSDRRPRILLSAILHLAALGIAVSLGLAQHPASPMTKTRTNIVLHAPVAKRIVERRTIEALIAPTPPLAQTVRSSRSFLPVMSPQKQVVTQTAVVDVHLDELRVKPDVAPPIQAAMIATPRPLVLGGFLEVPQQAAEARSNDRCSNCGRARLTPLVVASEAPAKVTRSGSEFGSVAGEILESQPAGKRVSATQAVLIEHKPRPEYSSEGREKRIEGEVVLQVLFRATGTAEPVRVVRGLGFGLDESAWSAVSAIRFRPALRDGEAMDQLATVHFIFKLAY